VQLHRPLDILPAAVAQPSQIELLEPVDPRGVEGRIYGGMLASG